MSLTFVRTFSLVVGLGLLVKGAVGGEFKKRYARELQMSKRTARLMCLGLGAFFIWIAIFRS
jgi:hypothetical protein